MLHPIKREIYGLTASPINLTYRRDSRKQRGGLRKGCQKKTVFYSPGALSTRVKALSRKNRTGWGLSRSSFSALPVAQLHHQQRRAEEEGDSIRQDDGQRVDHEAVAHPQQEAYVEADQHEQREIADGLAAEGVQGLRKIRQRAQRARGKAG